MVTTKKIILLDFTFMILLFIDQFCRFSGFWFLDLVVQVVNLQAQLACLKEQAAQSILSNRTAANPNPNPNHHDHKFQGESPYSLPQDVQSWWQSCQNQGTTTQFDASFESNNVNENSSMPYYSNGAMYPNNNPSVKYESSSCFPEENTSSFGSMDSLEMQSNGRQWTYQDDADDLQSVAFRYMQHSWSWWGINLVSYN